MGGLGARGRGLELRPEWAEGLPGGVSVVTGRQMLGGSGGCLAAASAEVPFGGFSIFNGEEARSSAVSGGGREAWRHQAPKSP